METQTAPKTWIKLRDALTGVGADGRSTKELADACEISLSTARKHLWAAEGRGEVGAYDEGASGFMGNTIFWKLTSPN